MKELVAGLPLYFAYRAYAAHVSRLEEEHRRREVIKSVDTGAGTFDSAGPAETYISGTFSLPAGSYSYKAALNDAWTENYGLHAQEDGARIYDDNDGVTIGIDGHIRICNLVSFLLHGNVTHTPGPPPELARLDVPQEEWHKLVSEIEQRENMKAEGQEVKELGGLHIIGTERHESRRIDNQLRGRSGRQGDPGSSRFYLSLQDDLLRIFGGERMQKLMLRLGMEEDMPIESKLITKRIAAAQKAVEVQNFEARKHLLEYDDVMNKQRVAVYGLRKELLSGIDQKGLILEDYVANMVASALDRFAPRNVHADQWDVEALNKYLVEQFGLDMSKAGVDADQLNRQELGDQIFEKLKELYEAKEKQLGPDAMRYHERMIMLSVLDSQWKDHLLGMDHLKEGIGLRGYGQHDPLVEYKRESFDMFEAMMQRFQEETVRYLYLMQILERPPEGGAQEADVTVPRIDGDGNGRRPPRAVATSVDEIEEAFQRKKRRELEQARMAGSGDLQPVQQVVRGSAKIGRNDPCPCGSGKKYKKCCGTNA
jgi:preprotein translocase subunit SecA